MILSQGEKKSFLINKKGSMFLGESRELKYKTFISRYIYRSRHVNNVTDRAEALRENKTIIFYGVIYALFWSQIMIGDSTLESGIQLEFE